eukprot:5226836-Prymnesium_polylepis.1
MAFPPAQSCAHTVICMVPCRGWSVQTNRSTMWSAPHREQQPMCYRMRARQEGARRGAPRLTLGLTLSHQMPRLNGALSRAVKTRRRWRRTW